MSGIKAIWSVMVGSIGLCASPLHFGFAFEYRTRFVVVSRHLWGLEQYFLKALGYGMRVVDDPLGAPPALLLS